MGLCAARQRHLLELTRLPECALHGRLGEIATKASEGVAPGSKRCKLATGELGGRVGKLSKLLHLAETVARTLREGSVTTWGEGQRPEALHQKLVRDLRLQHILWVHPGRSGGSTVDGRSGIRNASIEATARRRRLVLLTNKGLQPRGIAKSAHPRCQEEVVEVAAGIGAGEQLLLSQGQLVNQAPSGGELL